MYVYVYIYIYIYNLRNLRTPGRETWSSPLVLGEPTLRNNTHVWVNHLVTYSDGQAQEELLVAELAELEEGPTLDELLN